ncbi:ABC transporter permease [Streptomyces beijiangensis]|uniref:ABC transporter permease n=1 Tax=Streptomyces beijiangensis TaxID=163361 RepID=A0A939F5A4_9ACTN|nr:ABC transporter permease [Streptomyces beijiangensis]MBO0512158.1 ABC transporter permease [Streptomyces beijiangensis]
MPTTPPSRRTMITALVLIPLIAAAVLCLFAWPAARTAPRDVPIGLAGTPAATAGLQQKLDRQGSAFEVHRYADDAAARAAIKHRDVYGAVVVTAQGPHLLTASAASPVVAQLLQKAAAELAPAGSTAIPVADVVSPPAADPRGTALTSSILPLAMAGMAAGVIVTLFRLRGIRAAAVLVAASALVGLAAAAVTDSWLGVFAGSWWAEAGVLGLAVLSIGALVAGLAALLGTRGIGIGALLTMLVGNAFSGAGSAPQLLPEPAGMIGQLLPPGAAATLLRSVAYFDSSAALVPALTLGAWAVLGLAGVMVGGMRARRAAATASGTPAQTPQLEPVG